MTQIETRRLLKKTDAIAMYGIHSIFQGIPFQFYPLVNEIPLSITNSFFSIANYIPQSKCLLPFLG